MQRTFSKANRRLVVAGLGVFSFLAIGANSAKAALIESWENTLDGWVIPPSYNPQPTYAPVTSFSTTSGVTNGSYSLVVAGTGTGSPNYGQFGYSPSTLAITNILATASAITLDVYTPPASFGYYLQWQLIINGGGLGFDQLPGQPSASIGNETTLSWPITPAMDATLAASNSPAQIILQVGGGYSAGNETMYLDNLQTVSAPEPASIGLLGAAGLLTLRRRHRA
jgi:hypothetical protein